MLRRICLCILFFLIPTPFLSPHVQDAEAQTMTRREIRHIWKRARKAYKKQKYGSASQLFFDIIENGSAAPSYQRLARYNLARSLFYQDLHLVSLRYVNLLLKQSTVENIDRPFLISLNGLLRISETIGDETLIIKLLKIKPLLRKIPKDVDPIHFLLPLPQKYKENEKYENWWKSRRKKIRNSLAYMLGRLHFLRRSPGFATAHRFLKLVEPQAKNNYYAKSLYLQGVMHAWKGKNPEAIKLFEKILLVKPAKEKNEALNKVKKFAQYGIARAYYAMGAQSQLPKKRRTLLVNSLREYAKLKKNKGVLQAQVLFEVAYAHFMLEQYHFSLGKLMSLQSPYYEMGYFPELQILRALIYYKNCKYDSTKDTVSKFEKEFRPLQAQLKELVSRQKTKKWLVQYYDFFKKEETQLLSKKKTTIPGSLIVRIGEEKSLQNYQALLSKLEKELSIIRSKGVSWKESNLGKALLEIALNFQTTLKKFAGNSVRNSMRRSLLELDNLLGQAGLIQLETLQAQKKEFMRYAEGGGIEQDEYRYTTVTEQNHRYWPYQGEYWRDEIGSYRQFIQGECKR